MSSAAVSSPNPIAPPYSGYTPFPGEVQPVPEPRAPTLPERKCPVICGGLVAGAKGAAPNQVVPAAQPVVPVPVYQEIHRKDCIVEVPQTIIKDVVIPRVWQQDVNYEVPAINLTLRRKEVNVPRVVFRKKVYEIPVPVQYIYKTKHKWETRYVPKIFPKFVGPQEEIPIDVPQIQIVDKIIEKETPVFVGEKFVKKEVVEEDPVEVVQYKYVEQERDVELLTYKQVVDVQVDIPPPLIVPVPVQPTTVSLEPEIISLDQWKRLKKGGATYLCNEYSVCGPKPVEDNALATLCGGQSSAVSCCQPGGLCSGHCH